MERRTKTSSRAIPGEAASLSERRARKASFSPRRRASDSMLMITKSPERDPLIPNSAISAFSCCWAPRWQCWLRNPQWHRHLDKPFGNRNNKRPVSEILGVYQAGPRLTTGPQEKERPNGTASHLENAPRAVAGLAAGATEVKTVDVIGDAGLFDVIVQTLVETMMAGGRRVFPVVGEQTLRDLRVERAEGQLRLQRSA
jgi:hypothetical protein